QRIDGQARFQVDETSLLTYAPYFLLPYGSTLRILEPLALKQKLSAIATDLAAYYKT
ncbi:DNA-binding transcriptional regulator, partial [Paenibacillus odorifer]